MLIVAGCGAVSPTALIRTSQLDPLTTDPVLIAARLDVPGGIKIPEGGATLSMSAERADTDETLSGTYTLIEEDAVWRLSPDDRAAFRELQRQIRDWKAAYGDEAVSGSLSIALSACTEATGPDPQAPIAVDLSLDGGARFFPFLRDLTVQDVTDALNTPEARCTP